MMDFFEDFNKMINYGFLGIYKRLSLSERNSKEKFVPALSKVCAIGAFLNLKYKFKEEDEPVFPETEYQLFEMFKLPLKEIIEVLPKEYQDSIKEHSIYYTEAFISELEEGKVVITEEGYETLQNVELFNSKDVLDQMGEYNGQRIFKKLVDGDYIKNRMFLEQPQNTYIAENSIGQNDEQSRFIKYYPELFNMCYLKNTRVRLYRCKRCGMILKENKQNVFSCVSKKCNDKLDEKIEVKMSGPGWIINDIVARSIYYPGQLEQKIKQLLDKGVKQKTIKKYEIWPGRYEGEYDIWDFKVTMNEGKVLLLDAKDVQNPHWLIWDKRQYKKGAEFIYIVPNDRTKTYLEQVRGHVNCIKNHVQCIRVCELEKMIGVK